MQIKTFSLGGGIEMKVRFFTIDEYTPPKLVRFENDEGGFDEVIMKTDSYYKTPQGFYAEYIDVVMEKDKIEHILQDVELQRQFFETQIGFKVREIF